MYVQKINAKARLPSIQNDNSYLVYAAEDVNVPARGDAIVPTGIYIAVPPNHTVRATSGAEAFPYGIEVSEFCSVNYPNPHRVNTDPKPVELTIKVYNLGKADYVIKTGSSIGRILVMPTFAFEVLETDVAEVMRSPPKTTDRMEKKFTAPKTAIAWFKSMYANEYDYVKTNFLNDKVIKEVEDYKQSPNYQTSTNKDNLEATWAWGHLDETVKERIRREMIVRNEQYERIAQMSGTDMSKVQKDKKVTKVGKKAKDDDDEKAEESDSEDKDNKGDEKVDGDPDEAAPEDGEREPIERIEDEDDEEEVEEEEVAKPPPAKPAPKPAPKPAAAPPAEDSDDEEVAKPAAKPAPAKPAAPKAKPRPQVVAPVVAAPEPAPARPKAAARPAKKPAARV